MDLDPKLNLAPENVKTVHLMGIGGVAMGALAGGLKKSGFSVRGSDRPLYPPMSTFLEKQGIAVATGYAPENLEPRPDLVIVGNVIRKDNPEAVALAESGMPYLSLPQALARFFIRDRLSMVAAGTHGKTTCTALLASALGRGGFKPGFMVGGIMLEGETNFSPGAGNIFVCEGDEYDTAFFDKRPKFVHYRTSIGILTSCEFDHADIYADMDAIRVSFDTFAKSIPPSGRIIAWGDSPEVMARAAKAACKVETYGLGPDCAWRLVSLAPAETGGARIRLKTPDGGELDFHSPLAGEHNALNTCAVVAALCAAGLAPQRAGELQAGFRGVKRRQELRGVAGGVTVVDDFAHHPTAVRETIKALAQFGLPGWRPGSGRLVAVFEPRTNTSKQNIFQEQYAGAFAHADLVFLREPPGVEDLEEDRRFSSKRLAKDLAGRGITATAYPGTDTLLDALAAELKPGDLALVMSNGGFDNLHQRLLERLAQG